MKKLLTLCFLFGALSLTSCATKTGLDKYDGQTPQQIFSGADTALQKGDYKDANERYEAMQALYPYGDYAQQTNLNIIYSYYEDRDYDSAVAASDRYIHLYPQGPAADYAYYMKGLAEFSRNIGFFERYLPINISTRDMASIQQSFTDFNALLSRFPNSAYAPDARQRMIFLRNTLAKHELQIGQYYYSRKAYVAAAERGHDIIINFQHTPQVKDALLLMYQSYQQLHLTEQQQQVYQVIRANYPVELDKLKAVTR